MKPHLRARIISEWRGLPEPTPKPERLTSMTDAIPKLMKSLGLGARLKEEEVLSSWRRIVGDFIADHSQPSKLQNGVLIVQVLQPTMLYELDRVWKTRILEKLREQFGARTVKEVRFRIG